MRIRSYSELKQIDSFHDRFEYLSLKGTVGRSTFGYDRYINQMFYTSREWRSVRNLVIDRDQGCDLGSMGYEIFAKLVIHHMNPITAEHIIGRDEDILNPEFLITTTHDTHNAIHYGDASLLPRIYTPRRRGDTRLW